ncbi:MAG TPA: ATP cone domain-containing protein, partial [Opitutaceae bacterium]|nr:ATP cone domain-containing protein [Opitutaceae bacterium]
MSQPSFEHDLALKRFASAPKDQKPNFNWRDVLRDESTLLPDLRVVTPDGEQAFDLAEIADTIGKSLTNLLLAKGESDIFSEKNQKWVALIAREVANNLTRQTIETKQVRLSITELYVLIEKTLADNNAFDVAKSLLLSSRARKLSNIRDQASIPVRLIRRNHQVVPWNEGKIEIAVRTAFLSLQKDSAPALIIARAVTERVLGLKQAFVHIEEVQDMVQEELMKTGHYKVAEQYILYRARRDAARENEPQPEALAPAQNSMIVVK